MFCPSCGLEDKQSNQFCRACGADLRVVRGALGKPDSITLSATTAREEIGRALAARVREAQTATDMKIIAEDVLPEIEKFLESPEARRLRRLRVGTITASVGAGIFVGFAIASKLMSEEDVFFIAGMGLICFFIGLGFIINGLLFTVPNKTLPDNSGDASRQRELDAQPANPLVLPEASNYEFASVIENTTRRLKEKQPSRR